MFSFYRSLGVSFRLDEILVDVGNLRFDDKSRCQHGQPPLAESPVCGGTDCGSSRAVVGLLESRTPADDRTIRWTNVRARLFRAGVCAFRSEAPVACVDVASSSTLFRGFPRVRISGPTVNVAQRRRWWSSSSSRSWWSLSDHILLRVLSTFLLLSHWKTFSDCLYSIFRTGQADEQQPLAITD